MLALTPRLRLLSVFDHPGRRASTRAPGHRVVVDTVPAQGPPLDFSGFHWVFLPAPYLSFGKHRGDGLLYIRVMAVRQMRLMLEAFRYQDLGNQDVIDVIDEAWR